MAEIAKVRADAGPGRLHPLSLSLSNRIWIVVRQRGMADKPAHHRQTEGKATHMGPPGYPTCINAARRAECEQTRIKL